MKKLNLKQKTSLFRIGLIAIGLINTLLQLNSWIFILYFSPSPLSSEIGKFIIYILISLIGIFYKKIYLRLLILRIISLSLVTERVIVYLIYPDSVFWLFTMINCLIGLIIILTTFEREIKLTGHNRVDCPASKADGESLSHYHS